MHATPQVTHDLVQKWRASLSAEIAAEWEFGPADETATPVSFMAALEFREHINTLAPDAERVECDALVMALGQSDHQHVTKFGGLPYRPSTQKWPTSSEGMPLMFVGQFCFADSKDLFGKLPGDVLLFFSDGDYFVSDPGFFYFEWQPLGLRPLVREDECLGALWPFSSGFGMRFRTWDFRDVERIGEFAVQQVRASSPFEPVSDFVRKVASRLPGPKIGGLPCWRSVDEEVVPKDQQFLCSFPGFGAAPGAGWPWANREVPMTLEEARSPKASISFWDGFLLNLFINNEGAVIPWLDIG